MKYLCLLPIFNFWTLVSQDVFISRAQIEYDLIQTSLSGSSLIKATLLFNNERAVFIYQSKSEAKTVEVNESHEEQPNHHNVIIKTVLIDTLENRIYTDKANNLQIKTVYDFETKKQRYLRDNIEDLPWEITSESKRIQSFYCLKAKLNYSGQKFVAWFAPEIPTSFGPLHFGNLAGLILEMYSEDKQFYLASTKVIYPLEQTIAFPEPDSKYITQLEYKALKAKYLDSINHTLKERLIRILTKSQRGINISNIKVETKTTKNKSH